MAKKWAIVPGGKWAVPTGKKWQVGDEGDPCCCGGPRCSICGTDTITAVGSGFVNPSDTIWNGTVTLGYLRNNDSPDTIQCLFSFAFGTGPGTEPVDILLSVYYVPSIPLWGVGLVAFAGGSTVFSQGTTMTGAAMANFCAGISSITLHDSLTPARTFILSVP